MSPTRRPIEPPQLAGYSFKERLGAGGFADVFLYEREFPRQDVAIKVLDQLVGAGGGRERFVAEANAMASLSTHPYIVTIFHADVSPEDHPYLVMEYYPQENYSVRARTERFPVAHVLRLGVQVASAVETAHRSGILHRDIKPANVLTSTYGRPGLTDFGIAASREADISAVEGLSIPWSPPEALAGASESDGRSDVYSLAATLFNILEGHSPFERSDQSNRSIDLIDRIEREPLPEFERRDAPSSLYRLLAQAMAKDPNARPSTAAEFARTLQAIEVEMRFDPTPLEVTEDHTPPTETQAIDADAGSTRLKGPTVVEGQSRFSAPTETVSRDQIRTAGGGSAASVPIRGVPFALPPTTPIGGGAAIVSARPTGPGPSRPSSSSYRPDERVATSASPILTRPKRSNRPKVIGAIAAAVVVVSVVVGLVLATGGDGSSILRAPIVTSWEPISPTSSTAVVKWSTNGNQPGDTYAVVYGTDRVLYPSKNCGESDGTFYCKVVGVTPQLGVVKVIRTKGNESSPPGTLAES